MLLFALVELFHFGCCSTKVVVVIKKDMTGAGFVVVRVLVRCVVIVVMADFLFLLWWSWSYRGLRGSGNIAVLQFVKLEMYPVFSAVNVPQSVIRVNEGCAGIHPFEHPLPCTRMAKVAFLRAVVAVGWRSATVFSLLRHRRAPLSGQVVLSPDLWTSISQVPRHATAVTLFVPVRSLATGVEGMSREATVVAVLIGTFNAQVAWVATKEAGLHLFRIGTVLGEMSGPVAVVTLDTLASIVSV